MQTIEHAHPSGKMPREHVLVLVDHFRARTRVLAVDLQSISVALRGDLIEPDRALEWMAEIGVLIPADGEAIEC